MKRTLFWVSRNGSDTSYAGEAHLPHPTKRGMTRCRRSTKGMYRETDGTAFCTCDACRDLIRSDVAAEMYGSEKMP